MPLFGGFSRILCLSGAGRIYGWSSSPYVRSQAYRIPGLLYVSQRKVGNKKKPWFHTYAIERVSHPSYVSISDRSARGGECTVPSLCLTLCLTLLSSASVPAGLRQNNAENFGFVLTDCHICVEEEMSQGKDHGREGRCELRRNRWKAVFSQGDSTANKGFAKAEV